jgi:RND superfamily putative drug exporter
MGGIFSTERIARFSARRPWLVVAAWVVLAVAGGWFGSSIGDVLTTDATVSEDVEYVRADELIAERIPDADGATEQIVVRSDTITAIEPRFAAFVEELAAELRALETVEAVVSPFEADSGNLVSADGHTAVITVRLAGSVDDAQDLAEPVIALVEARNEASGFEVLTAGDGSIVAAFEETAEKDAQIAEMFGLPIALIVLVIVFGALVAAGLPIGLALLAIVVAVGTTALLGRAYELSFFVINMITMIGLAVGIDYSLFIVERYREERRRGLGKHDAIAKAGGTAGKAVLFSGLTVIVALLGLLIVPQSIFRSLAAGAVIVAAFAVLGALTLLPAVLSLLGDKVNAVRLPFRGEKRADMEGGFWAAVATTVMRHPVMSVVASVTLLVAAAAPYLTMELGTSGVSTLPNSVDAFRAFRILDEEFSVSTLQPADIVVDAKDVNAPAVQASIDALRARLAEDGSFGAADVHVNEAGDLAVISVNIEGDPQENGAHDALHRLRDEHIPAAFNGVDADVLVTGPTAETVDTTALINKYTPWVFAFVLGLSFVLLLLVFRSVVVPVKAILMNLLSVGAAYGLIVLVFQHGVGNELLGVGRVERIEAWLPLFLFAVLFGLSMDYHVFLLSRIRERFDQTGDNAGAVAFGVRSTASIITGAALIMVAVFGGFMMGDLVSFQQTGFGLAVAVILDATIVRSVLVPASMVLLGDLNWYMPKWLAWLPELRIEAESTEDARRFVPETAALVGGD